MFYKLVLTPIFLSTILIYLIFSFFGTGKIESFFALLPLFIGTFQVMIKTFKTKSINKNVIVYYFIPALLIIFDLIVIGITLSPMVLNIKVDNINFVQFTGVNDFYKHVYSIVAILGSKLPGIHPYFPVAKFSYYYGYYLIPSAFAKLFNIPYNYTMYFYPIISNGIVLILLYYLINKHLKTYWLKIICLALLIFGTGLDIIPTHLLNNSNIVHIESWSQELNLGLIVNNTFMSFLWVPQHVMSSLALIFICYELLQKKSPSLFFIISGLCFTFLTSSFVAITSIVWFALFFIFKKEKRFLLINVGLVSLIILIPFLYQMKDRVNLLSFYTPGFYRFFFITSNIILDSLFNRFANLIVEYGLIFFILLVFLFNSVRKEIDNILYFLMIVIPILITWIVRSPGPNDFGMRSILPIQLITPLFFAKYLECNNLSKKLLLISMLLFNLCISGYGYFYEHINSYKDRRLLSPDESLMISWIRKLPDNTRIMTVQKSNWGFFIPPLGFKSNLNPHLYDSGVYISGNIGSIHAKYEQLGKDLFDGDTVGSSSLELVENKNKSLSNLYKYISMFPFDKMIITKKVWVKNGINPWFILFGKYGVVNEDITSNFVSFNYNDLIDKIANYQVKVDSQNNFDVEIKNNKFYLRKGLWFITGCNDFGVNSVKLDLQDYFMLLDSSYMCAGDMFYIDKDASVKIFGNTNLSKLKIYPLSINKI